MPISLKQTAGGGLFRLRNKVTGTIASGVTGNILTLTAPAGQVAKLTVLACSSTTSQAGISVIADGNTVLTGSLAGVTAIYSGGTFFVNRHYGTTAEQDIEAKSAVDQVVGEVIIINKNAGNTTQGIEYSVEYGVMI